MISTGSLPSAGQARTIAALAPDRDGRLATLLESAAEIIDSAARRGGCSAKIPLEVDGRPVDHLTRNSLADVFAGMGYRVVSIDSRGYPAPNPTMLQLSWA